MAGKIIEGAEVADSGCRLEDLREEGILLSMSKISDSCFGRIMFTCRDLSSLFSSFDAEIGSLTLSIIKLSYRSVDLITRSVSSTASTINS